MSSAIVFLMHSPEAESLEMSIEENGNKASFFVDSDIPAEKLLKEFVEYLDEKDRLSAIEMIENSELFARVTDSRDYYGTVTDSQVKDMCFIVMTLGNEPLLKLKQYKNDLESAGDRLDSVHPLNFWKTIFSDEKTISAMHSIKHRKKVWKSFIKGMGKSLQLAFDANNLKPEYITDFATHLEIDPAAIQPFITKNDWEELAKQLLILVPREGNIDRYDQ